MARILYSQPGFSVLGCVVVSLRSSDVNKTLQSEPFYFKPETRLRPLRLKWDWDLWFRV